MSKCASCDQHNAFTYCPDADDMYCVECYEQKLIDNECYCDDDRGITCHIHIEDQVLQSDTPSVHCKYAVRRTNMRITT